MYRFYLASTLTALGLFGYAQFKGWSVMPSEAQEFQRARAAKFEQASRPGGWSSGSSGGFSGK